MISFMLCTSDTAHQGGPELLEQWRAQTDAWLWVDLQDEPALNEKALLCDALGLDEHAVAEAQRPRHPPGFEAFPDHVYLLLKALTSDTDDLDFATQQLAVFAGPRLLVTRHAMESRFLQKKQKKLAEQGCAGITPYGMLAAITRRVANRYGQILLDLEQRLDEIEDEIFDTPSDRLMEELIGYNTSLRKMRRILAYHMNAVEALRDTFDPLDQKDWYDEFDDIFGLMERFHSLADLYQNLVSDLVDGYISLNAHHLNQIMKVLTIVTVIFVPLTLLVGVYGMNFEYIPELKSHYGYYILLSVMATIAVGLLLLFRRVRWL